MFRKLWSLLTNNRDKGYHISDLCRLPVTVLLTDDEFRPEAINVEVWNIVSRRIKTSVHSGVQAVRDGNDRAAANAMLLLLSDIETLSRLVGDHRLKEKDSNVKRTERKHLIR